MTRRSKTALVCLGIVALVILYFVYGCERTDDETVSLPPPLGNVEFDSFSVLEWLTSPSQEIKIRLKQQSDIEQLVDLTPRADGREFSFFDSENELILDVWMREGGIDHMELFKHVDR